MGQEMTVTLIKLKGVGHIASLHVHMIQSKGVSKEEGAQDKGCPPRHLGLQSATFNLYLTLPLP